MKIIENIGTPRDLLNGVVMTLLVFAFVLTGCDGGGTTGPVLDEEDDEDVPDLNISAILDAELDSTAIPEALEISEYGIRLQITNNNAAFAGRGRITADGSTVARLDISGGQYDYPSLTMDTVEAWEYDEEYDESLYQPFSVDGTIIEYGEHPLLDGLFIKELEAVITGGEHWLNGDTLTFVDQSVE